MSSTAGDAGVPLLEEMAQRVSHRITEEEARLARLRAERRRVAEWMVEGGYSVTAVAKALSVTRQAVEKMLSREES